MNAKLLAVLVGVFAVSSVSPTHEFATADVNLVDIPECEPQVLATAGFVLKNNDRKVSCQKQLKVEELLKIPPNDTVTLKAMCDSVACTAALKNLYTILPDCRYLDWPFKRSVADELRYCGIDPATIVAEPENGNATTSEPSSNTTDVPTTTRPPANWTSSSSAGTEFAPVGETPSPSPTTLAPPSTVPAPTPTNGAQSVFAATATAAAIAVAATVVAM